MTPILAAIDPWILTFSAVTVIATIFVGFWSAKSSKTASDFFVAGRSVSVGWNASAISGEYLSAASFMGVAGMVMSSGYDALWYPVCYACGYLFLLLFIAGPLRRFGAYTIPDFAEGRFDSPLFRKIAVVFVLFIGFFYTMPQMKGAGTTLAYIFPGLPYWVGVVLVGAVITLNVALGGMKGITLVQAFQYWAKMFAISVPVFVLMAVYGHYGKQVELNAPPTLRSELPPMLAGNADTLHTYKRRLTVRQAIDEYAELIGRRPLYSGSPTLDKLDVVLRGRLSRWGLLKRPSLPNHPIEFAPAQTAPDSLEPGGPTDVAMSLVPARRSSQGMRVFGTPSAGKGFGIVTEDFVQSTKAERAFDLWRELNKLDVQLVQVGNQYLSAREREHSLRAPLPEKAPKDETWLNPFGPLTTKAARAVKPKMVFDGPWQTGSVAVVDAGIPKTAAERTKSYVDVKFSTNTQVGTVGERSATSLVLSYAYYLGRSETLNVAGVIHVLYSQSLDGLKIDWPGNPLKENSVVADAMLQALATNGVVVVRESPSLLKAFTAKEAKVQPIDVRPYSLLYTYSLIIALVCGTAGLPHILVRFYTNPDGVAAKRTTMWVMILIGVFYVFPPVFGVLGRNLMPDLYNGLTGVKGTDGVVLRLPTILRERYGPLGSILSGVTCAGAFAAFMSTFSGLLVSMTGALAHDVYGRMLAPKSTPEQRLHAFKICAVLIGGIAILLGCFVEPLEINFMVGQAFAIAAASYFPLLFMSVWWRGMTMRGAATGMLAGGLCALAAVALTNVSNLALDKGPMGRVFAGFAPLNEFWAAHPLLRILCEQPALWTVPLAIGLMMVVSKLTAKTVPADIRMKMLVLHAPEKLGLKQEYIQEHQGH